MGLAPGPTTQLDAGSNYGRRTPGVESKSL